MMRCCFDKRVWIGLGVLAAGLLVFDPHLGWVVLPVLAGLACPLSMLVMMRGMRPGAACDREPADGPAGRTAEIARLRRDIELLKNCANQATAPGEPAPAAPGEHEYLAGKAGRAAGPAPAARRGVTR